FGFKPDKQIGPTLPELFARQQAEALSEIERSKSGVQGSAVSEISTQPPPTPGICLECAAVLPALLPSGARPSDICENCGLPLLAPALCQQPGLDHCLSCEAAQPHPLPNGERPLPHCHKCGTKLHHPEPLSATASNHD